MKVLHVTQPTEAGVARHVLDLAGRQAATGGTPVVASPFDDAFVGALKSQGVDWLRWDAVREPSRAIRTEARELRKAVDRCHPDVVHLHSSKAGLVGRLFRRDGVPILFTPNGWSIHATSGAQRRLAVGWERIAARRTSAIVCVSASERNFATSLRIGGRLVVIPNAVDTEMIRPAQSHLEVRATRQNLGISSGSVVVCVGRLTKAKGQGLLLDAWLRMSSVQATLYIIGNGEDEALLKSHAAARTNVVFVGHRGDTASWLRCADVVVVPSRWDGLSYVLIEAMATGASIVATDAVGAVDALGTGYQGLTHHDPDELAAAILTRIRDPALRRHEGAALRARAVELFDLKPWFTAHQRLYREILAP